MLLLGTAKTRRIGTLAQLHALRYEQQMLPVSPTRRGAREGRKAALMCCISSAPFSEQYCLKACSNSFCVSGGGVSSASLFLGLLRRRFCAESSPGVLRAMAPPRCRPQ